MVKLKKLEKNKNKSNPNLVGGKKRIKTREEINEIEAKKTRQRINECKS